jgi:UDP-glucose 4-epimerase
MAEAIDIPSAYNQIFNIGADRPYSINELAQTVACAMGVEADIAYVPARNEVQHAFSSHDKTLSVFGERELFDLDEGIARMAEWVRKYGARTSQEFENIEVTKNFPKAWLTDRLTRAGAKQLQLTA